MHTQLSTVDLDVACLFLISTPLLWVKNRLFHCYMLDYLRKIDFYLMFSNTPYGDINLVYNVSIRTVIHMLFNIYTATYVYQSFL